MIRLVKNNQEFIALSFLSGVITYALYSIVGFPILICLPIFAVVWVILLAFALS